MTADDTIFAPATGVGRAAIAVLRLSGPQTSRIVSALCGNRLPPPRRASLRILRNQAGVTLDHAIVLWFPEPASYTGEPGAELHLHGGPAVLDGVAETLIALGTRPADPGEFTRRAFLNNRLDLTEAEAIADLVEAETAAQRDQALRQLEGGLGFEFHTIAADIRLLLAEQEARIDFPDETGHAAPLEAGIRRLIDRLGAHLASAQAGERLRTGLTVAITGSPNAGKSSLVNALAARPAAIVASTPGTTRDVLEVRCILGGVPCILLDTAGLRDTTDPVEAEGIRRARARAAVADIVIHLHAADAGVAGPVPPGAILVTSKTDLATPPPDRIGISTITANGTEALRSTLNTHAQRLTHAHGPAPLTRERHRFATQAAIAHLTSALEHQADEIRAEELRLAMLSVGRLTGRVGVEDILETVFSRFCIGK